MIDAKIFISLPIPFVSQIDDKLPPKEICLIYPPSVLEILTDDNIKYISLFTLTQEDLEDKIIESNQKLDSNKVTPFSLIMKNCKLDEEYRKLVEKGFYFFIKQPVNFLFEDNSILIGDLKQTILNSSDLSSLPLLTEDNFFDFQNSIRKCIGTSAVEKPNENEHPKIKAMKAKARLRDRIKAKKADSITLGVSLAAICCMDLGLNPLNVGEISFASMRALTKMYQGKEKYELDIDSLLAGADSKKVKPEYWIKNLDN